MSTYKSDAACLEKTIHLIAEAQATLDEHAVGLNGLCISCRTTGPCTHRERAALVFYRYFRLRLPRRHPVTVAAEHTRVEWFCNARQTSTTGTDDRRAATHDAPA